MKPLLAVLMLLACGPVWEGAWVGPSNLDEACAGFSPTSDNFTTTWTISESEGSLAIVSGGSCGALSATVSGATAAIREKICPVMMDGQGNSLQRTLQDGTLTLSGDHLDTVLHGTALLTLTSGAQSACTNTQTSALSRQP